MREKILEAIDSPSKLESLYRGNPSEFVRAFPQALAAYPDSIILKVWRERLSFESREKILQEHVDINWNLRDVILIAALALIAGTLTKIPQFFPSIEPKFYYSRYLGFIGFMTMSAYFLIQNRCSMRFVEVIFGASFGALVFLNLLPNDFHSQTIVLSCIHVQFFFWTLLGMSFLGGRWRDLSGRLEYIRYNGELLIYAKMILIGGMILTGITLPLFNLLGVRITGWYERNIVVYGTVASPLVGTFISQRIANRRLKLAPILSRIFAPLFLATALAYLATMIIQRKSPYTDRDFLISFNILLMIVLGLSIFAISERTTGEGKSVSDFTDMSLISVTLVIDVVALSAILFRLSSYGMTPNRIAVLGANLLVFCHLSGILYHYIRFMRNGRLFTSLEEWIVRYIPVYTVWCSIVAFGFPLFFRLK